MGAAPQYKLTVSFEFGKRSRSRVSELKGRCQRQAKVKQPSRGEDDEAGREKKREAGTGVMVRPLALSPSCPQLYWPLVLERLHAAHYFLVERSERLLDNHLRQVRQGISDTFP